MFSIIIPLYNKEDLILRTIKSVLNQSFRSFELIIINDGSTDRSMEKIRHINDDRLKIFTHLNSGVSHSRNAGIQKASYDYLYFLDADDLMEEECLLNYSLLINKYPSHSIYAANFSITDTEGEKKKYLNFDFEGLLDEPLKLIANKELYLRPGSFVTNLRNEFSENIKVYEDLEYVFNLLKNNSLIYSNFQSVNYQMNYSTESVKLHNAKNEWIYWIDIDFLFNPSLTYYVINHLCQRVYVHLIAFDFVGAIKLFAMFNFRIFTNLMRRLV